MFNLKYLSMKKLKFSLVLLFLVLVFGGCEKNKQDEIQQNLVVDHELGALLLPSDIYAKLPVAPTIHLKAAATAITLVTPTPGDQGGEGSCVAWGTTYAARSITWVKNHSAPYDLSVNIFSPEYVYNQIKVKPSCGSGAYTTTALNLLTSQGVCTWNSMPYSDNSCSTMPNATQKTEAGTYKVTSYATVAIKVSAIKAQLASGFPVIVAGLVDKNFMYLGNGAVLTKRKGSLGGHCYCVVGYDDAKNAFKFQNSWGPTWASGGFGWINYNNITDWWQEAYVLSN